MKSNILQMERIGRIVYGKIPVSEESPVFNLFAERREICQRLLKNSTEADRQHVLNYLEDIEERIKLYLWLS